MNKRDRIAFQSSNIHLSPRHNCQHQYAERICLERFRVGTKARYQGFRIVEERTHWAWRQINTANASFRPRTWTRTWKWLQGIERHLSYHTFSCGFRLCIYLTLPSRRSRSPIGIRVRVIVVTVSPFGKGWVEGIGIGLSRCACISYRSSDSAFLTRELLSQG